MVALGIAEVTRGVAFSRVAWNLVMLRYVRFGLVRLDYVRLGLD